MQILVDFTLIFSPRNYEGLRRFCFKFCPPVLTWMIFNIVLCWYFVFDIFVHRWTQGNVKELSHIIMGPYIRGCSHIMAANFFSQHLPDPLLLIQTLHTLMNLHLFWTNIHTLWLGFKIDGQITLNCLLFTHKWLSLNPIFEKVSNILTNFFTQNVPPALSYSKCVISSL